MNSSKMSISNLFFLYSTDFNPYFLRSKDIESPSGNGDMAFQEVRIQQSVVEFILNHTEQIFNCDFAQIKPKEGMSIKKLDYIHLADVLSKHFNLLVYYIYLLYLYRTEFDVWGEVCHAADQWPV